MFRAKLAKTCTDGFSAYTSPLCKAFAVHDRVEKSRTIVQTVVKLKMKLRTVTSSATQHGRLKTVLNLRVLRLRSLYTELIHSGFVLSRFVPSRVSVTKSSLHK